LRRGLTLFELLLVLAVLVLVGAVVTPSLTSMYGSFKVTGAADAVRSAWARARAHAINDGRSYRFGIVPGTGNFRIAPDSGEFWAGSGKSSSNDTSATPPLVVEDTVPNGVLLSAPDISGGAGAGGGQGPVGLESSQYVAVVVFRADGTARDDTKVVIGTGRGRTLVLKLRSLTGSVTTEWVNP
jgi:Tfp pilus assembly protein FimT